MTLRRFLLALSLMVVVTLPLAAFGPRGGGGGGGARPNLPSGGGSGARPNLPSGGGGGARPNLPSGGGGGARPNIGGMSRPTPAPHPTPSFSGGKMPTKPNVQKPNFQKPSIGPKPSLPNRPTTLPGNLPKPGGNLGGGNRPNIGGGNLPKPDGNLPNLGGGNRPNIGGGNLLKPGGDRPVSGGGDRPVIGGGNRPNIGGNDRPQIGGSNRPNIGGNDRPQIGGGNRPNIGGDRPQIGNGNRPNIGGGDRPQIGIGNRPQIGVSNRPQIGNGYSPQIGVSNRPQIGNGNRPNIGNNVNVGNRPSININAPTNNVYRPNNNNIASNRPNYVNRPGGGWYGGTYRPPYYGLHNNCYHGGWGWAAPVANYNAGVAFGWLAGANTAAVYSNPYYVAPATNVTYLNYSEPLVIQSSSASLPLNVPTDATPEPTREVADAPASAEEIAQQESVKLFDQARDAFRTNDYAGAQTKVEAAIAKLPKDATLHEFRSLTLFAQRKYQDAAAAIYSVLAAGPGWDWETEKSFYGDTKTYEDQLRNLEQYQKENPTKGFASLLLGYHYLTLSYTDAAKVQLASAAKAEPKDQLAPALLKALNETSPGDDRPQPPK